jgi:ATP-dependent DNA helicase RecQ
VAPGTSSAEVAATGAIFDALRAFRLRTARALGVAPFVIASDRTLREIAAVRPSTIGELHGIYGIGQAKAEKYGPAFLEIVARAGKE